MTRDTSDRITKVAQYAFDAIRPAPGNRKPYAIERVFRESVKAVKDLGAVELSRGDYVAAVTGRVAKLPERSDQVYRVGVDDSTADGTFDERVERYAELFVDELLIGMCDNRPSQLKRLSNTLADGFYAATLRLQRELYSDDD
jgi:CRISPR-associated protein Csc3